MGIFDFFKKDKSGVCFVIDIDSKIPYSQRREKVGNYIRKAIANHHLESAVQYFHDGKEQNLTGLKIVLGDGAIKYVSTIIYQLNAFFNENNIKISRFDVLKSKPMKEEVIEMALESAKNIQNNKAKNTRKKKV